MDAPPSQIQQKIVNEQNAFPKQSSTVDSIFSWCIKRRSAIIFVYKLYYYVLVGFILFGGYASYYLTDNFLFFYNLAVWSGKAGLVFYVLTIIPGTARRFGVKHKLISLLMIFRRYNGIAMFLGVFAHFAVIRGAGYLKHMRIGWPMATFEFIGLVALILAFFLFLTSNDYSVFHLKKWWNKLHQLTYVIIWLIVFHVLLQRISVWSIVISIAVILQTTSFLYSWLLKNNIKPTVPIQNTPPK